MGAAWAVVATLVALAAPASAATGDITIFDDAPNLHPTGGMVEGPDGNLWFANGLFTLGTAFLGEVAPNGDITMHEVEEHDRLADVTVGGDGNLWFTTDSDEVGRFDPDTDTYDLFASPAVFSGAITAAPDGSLWVLGGGAGQVNLNGTLGLSTSNFGSASDIITGPDGNLWVSEVSGELRRINPTTGAETPFFTPAPGGSQVTPGQMTIGPDGEIWFTYSDGGVFGGVGTYDVSEDDFDLFPFSEDKNAKGITTGPDGNLWFLSRADDAINQMVIDGSEATITAFTDPAYRVSSSPSEITVAHGDQLWAGGTNDLALVDATPIDPACFPPAFSDVGTDHPFFEDICWMDTEGISTGYGDGTYKPALPVSRQAMSAFMYRLAGEPPFVEPGTATFSDVPTDHPFFKEIEWMAEAGVTNGFGDGTYRPSAAVSRGAMSAFMYRLADEPPFVAPGTPSFSDVPTNHPFFDEIEWMAEAGITNGFGDGTYKPAAAVSRQAMSAFMHRLDPLLSE